MSQQPGMTPPTPSEPGAPPLPKDEVAAAKARLRSATHTPKGEPVDPTRKANEFLREHPYIAAGAALGAGLAVARVATLRKLAVAGGMWAAKRYVGRYLRGIGR